MTDPTDPRRLRIRAINARLDEMSAERQALWKEYGALHLELEREEHPCACVMLNREIGVFDSHAQEQAGRVGLEFGLVAETLSARKHCPRCGGTGKPR